MPRDIDRTRRVGEQIQREIASLIQFDLKDPRLGMVTVSAVDVTRDLSIAHVFITVMNENQDRESTLKALQHAAGYLHRELGKRMQLRRVPQLRFLYDESIQRGADLSALIDAAISDDKGQEQDGT